MNAVEIEQAITDLAEQPFDPAEFPYAFLEAFGNKATTIKRLRAGASNKSDLGGVLQTSNIHILACDAGRVTQTLAALKASLATAKAKAKFILATDGADFEAEDLTSGEKAARSYQPVNRTWDEGFSTQLRTQLLVLCGILDAAFVGAGLSWSRHSGGPGEVLATLLRLPLAACMTRLGLASSLLDHSHLETLLIGMGLQRNPHLKKVLAKRGGEEYFLALDVPDRAQAATDLGSNFLFSGAGLSSRLAGEVRITAKAADEAGVAALIAEEEARVREVLGH